MVDALTLAGQSLSSDITHMREPLLQYAGLITLGLFVLRGLCRKVARRLRR